MKKTYIAYFSMEVMLEPDIPTYSGGLGILAGDTLRSAADMEIPMVAVTLVYNNGYFYQMVDEAGNQKELDIMWDFSSNLVRIPGTIKLDLGDDQIDVGAWRYDVVGLSGHIIPVYLLDTNLESNEQKYRDFTRVLYDATVYQRVAQELILGIGGVKWLRALGYDHISTYHMNEGHSAFLTLELLRELNGDEEEVRKRCVFTTHTPVKAGHERFSYDVIGEVFKDRLPEKIRDYAGDDKLNMTKLAMHFSRYINAVSRKHMEITRNMFPSHKIDGITNGVNSCTWIHDKMRKLYDRIFPNFRHDPGAFTDIDRIDPHELWNIHQDIKQELLEYEKSHSWLLMDRKLLTLGIARRITGYKRIGLILHDLDRLGEILQGRGQIIMAGKTHPSDTAGKDIIRSIYRASDYLWKEYRVSLAFLNNYDGNLSLLMTAGSDVWLNTPKRYLEASGTSGMKAAHNGVPNFSIQDGWWIEGYSMSEGAAGWSIGPGPDDPNAQYRSDSEDAEDLYNILEKEIIPAYFDNWELWTSKMVNSIKLAAYFNTHRMVREYCDKAWKLIRQPRWRPSDNE